MGRVEGVPIWVLSVVDFLSIDPILSIRQPQHDLHGRGPRFALPDYSLRLSYPFSTIMASAPCICRAWTRRHRTIFSLAIRFRRSHKSGRVRPHGVYAPRGSCTLENQPLERLCPAQRSHSSLRRPRFWGSIISTALRRPSPAAAPGTHNQSPFRFDGGIALRRYGQCGHLGAVALSQASIAPLPRPTCRDRVKVVIRTISGYAALAEPTSATFARSGSSVSAAGPERMDGVSFDDYVVARP